MLWYTGNRIMAKQLLWVVLPIVLYISGGCTQENTFPSDPHPAVQSTESPAPPARPSPVVEARMDERPSTTGLSTILLIQGLLVLVILGIFLSIARKLLRWRSSARRSRERVSPVVDLQIGVHTEGAPRRSLRFDRLPLRVASYGPCDLPLAPRGGAVPGTRFRFDLVRRNGGIRLVSASALMINGMLLREKTLKPGDRIACGRYRVFLESIVFPPAPRERVPAPDLAVELAYSLFLIVMGLILSALFPARLQIGHSPSVAAGSAPTPAPASTAGEPAPPALWTAGSTAPELPPATVERRVPIPRPEAVLAVSAPAPAPAQPSLAARAGAAFKLPALRTSLPSAGTSPSVARAPEAAPQPPRQAETVRTAKAVRRAEADVEPSRVEVILPGSLPDFVPADLLVFHAHPDDESLDFGALIARSARAGRRVVVVLFSDGEAGLDRYPERGSGGIYPGRELKGEALARVRVEEASRALSVLGARVYVRLGLPNHAYVSVAQEMKLPEVLRSWGGEETLVSRTRRLIEGYRPQIVVSPDGPSAAREHFEHEAVGYVVGKAIAEILWEGSVPLQGYLVSVDPTQRERYPLAMGIPVQDSPGGPDGRRIQALALRQHRTQRDAAVIGLNALAGLSREYYQVAHWAGPPSVDAWLQAGDLPAGDVPPGDLLPLAEATSP
jgi:LmbE family N-acetylglucosaminyl deacetylase